ncbi:MAG TPA: YgaB family protein [Bacillaceae bacterium]
MKTFNEMIAEQMKTMEKLLYLQSELERCLEIQEQLHSLQHETGHGSIQEEILGMKNELREIQRIFEEQTEEVIQSYKGGNGDYEPILG